MYSDAESEGYIGLVFIYMGKFWYAHGCIPKSIRRKLQRRRTNIMAYEIIAGVLAILALDNLLPERVCIRHYVDNWSAKQCIVKGHFKKPDHSDIVGILWSTAAHRSIGYWSEWVQSKANLADAPSRKDFSTMKQLHATEISINFGRYVAVTWKISPTADLLMRRG